METPTDNFIRDLTQRHRVIVLGGLAVIAHGFSRSTYDEDIWLDPMGSSTEWQVRLPALQNPSPEVRELAMTHLREFAAAGDPFSQAILEGRELP
jgi:hypothetical protein